MHINLEYAHRCVDSGEVCVDWRHVRICIYSYMSINTVGTQISTSPSCESIFVRNIYHIPHKRPLYDLVMWPGHLTETREISQRGPLQLLQGTLNKLELFLAAYFMVNISQTFVSFKESQVYTIRSHRWLPHVSVMAWEGMALEAV